MLQFRLLGTLDAGESGSVDLGGRKQRTLLAYLLLHRSEAIPRETLIDALWPDDPPATAGHALDVYVSRLRKSLGAEGLFEARGGSIRLSVSDEAVDAARFEQLLAGSRGAADPAERLVGLERALSLWRGRALADLLDEPSLRPGRERLEEERLVAEEERFEAMLALGRQDEAIGPLQALASEHPLRERPRRLLMLALYRAGRQSEALEVYRDFRRLLSDELGLEPSIDLRKLEAAILRQDETLAVPEPTKPAIATPASAARPSVRRRRRRGVAAIALVIAAGAAVAFAMLARGNSGGAPLTVPHLSAAAIDPKTGRVVKVVPLSNPPIAALAVGNTVWVASWATSTLTRLDDRTGAVLDTLGLPCHPVALAYGDGRIWIASGDRKHSLTAVDPRSGGVLWSKPLHQPGLGKFSSYGWGAHGIAFERGSVWVTVGLSGLLRVSPDGVLERSFVLGPEPTAVAATGSGVWTEVLGSSQVVQVDPNNNAVGHPIAVGNLAGGNFGYGPSLVCGLVASGPTVWAPAWGQSSSATSGIWRVDAIHHRIADVIHPGGSPCGVALSHGKVWVTNAHNYEIDEIDPRTDHFRRISLDAPPNAIAAAQRHVWVVTS